MANEFVDRAVAAFEPYLDRSIIVTPSKGRAAFRQLQIRGWPGRVHYEFLTDQLHSQLGVELHVEVDVPDVLRILPNLVSEVRREIAEDDVSCEPWYNGRLRIRVLFPLSTAPCIVARAMDTLIRTTRPHLDAALRHAAVLPER
jgi:hypothetical protein